jgi:hypothetical protein
VPATTPPSHAYYNTATPPTAAATSGRKKNTTSTAKKLFDSPAGAGADVTVRGGVNSTPAEATSPEPVAVRKLAGSPVFPAPVSAPATSIAAPEYASQSSEDSAVVVNPSDANSLADLADDDLPLAPAVSTSSAVRPPAAVSSAGVAAAVGASPAAGKTGFSQETAKYLAALDDQDEEEDGWN